MTTKIFKHTNKTNVSATRATSAGGSVTKPLELKEITVASTRLPTIAVRTVSPVHYLKNRIEPFGLTG